MVGDIVLLFKNLFECMRDFVKREFLCVHNYERIDKNFYCCRKCGRFSE